MGEVGEEKVREGKAPIRRRGGEVGGGWEDMTVLVEVCRVEVPPCQRGRRGGTVYTLEYDCTDTLGPRCTDIFKANLTGADIFPI